MNSKPFFSRSLFKVAWRYLLHHIWQSVLMVLGISMGVAVIVGIDIANTSASRAFDLSTEAIVGRATHYISGGSQGVDESVYVGLRRAGLEIPSAPILTDYVTSPQMDGTTLQLLGIDPFTEAPFRNYLGGAEGVPFDALTNFLTHPGSVLLSQDLAERYSLDSDSEFEINYAGRVIEVSVAGLLKPIDSLTRQTLDGLLLVDIATAQEITGRFGRVDRVDLILTDEDETNLQEIQEILPPGVLVLPNEVRNGTVEQITAAFRLNLTALSLLALVVALFLIYNTMTFSVVQRRPLFGTLRSLGVTRLEVFLVVVSEAFVIGLLGAIIGTLLGILMGRGAVGLVSQTINDLFFVATVQNIPLPVNSLIKGIALGILATVITAAFPAWEAASVPPRTALSRANLESKAQRAVHWLGIAGVLIIIVGFIILAFSGNSLFISFVGTFAAIFGFAILTPTFTVWLMKAANQLTSRIWGLLGRMAPREVVNSISRTSIAVAALMVAI
ncbi:MAG: FtsX-like permease family protein, partial [Chloroflexota bacterium]